MRKKLLNTTLIFLMCLVAVGLARAYMIQTKATVSWDNPGFEQGYVAIDHGLTPAPDYRLVYEIQARDAESGEVLATQSIESDCESMATPGTGQCGTITDWTWETDAFAADVEVEEWFRGCWRAAGFPAVCGVIHLPPDCELPEGVCFTELNEENFTITLSDECIDALALCGHVVEDGWQRLQIFQGTGDGEWYDDCPPDPTCEFTPEPTLTPRPTYTPLPMPTCRPTIVCMEPTPYPTATLYPISTPYPEQP